MKFLVDVKQYDVLSLDIFDTLWLRAVAKPIDIFEIVWRRVKEQGQNIMDLTEFEFLKLRVEMERRARSRVSHKEITLADIYQEIPPYIVKKQFDLVKLEVEVEKEMGYLNPDILELIDDFRKQGKKVILLSDMYLTEKQIRELLASGGFDLSWVNHVVISSEKKCNKQSGELYQELEQLFPEVSKSRILHIGDNKSGDYLQAQKFGIEAHHYNVIPNKLNSIYDYEKIRHDIPQPAILSLRKIAAHECSYDTPEKQLAFEIGASIIGPFLTIFVSHVINRMQQLGIHAIYPLMREGYLLGELLKNDCKEQNLPIKVNPIYTSRKASYIPAIEKVNREEIENIIGVRNITILELIEVLGLEKEAFEGLEEYFDTKLKVSHTILIQKETSLKEYIITRLLEPENISKIEKFVSLERKKYVDYLKQEIGDFSNVATVDIGSVGRIQQWTEKALRMEGIEPQMSHFFAMGITGERVYNGMRIEGYMGTYAENQDLMTTIYRSPDVLEKLASVCEGSTIGYERISQGIKPLQAQGVKNDVYTKIVFQGVLTFQKYWFYFRKHKAEIAQEVINNRRDTLKILHRLIDMPLRSEVSLLMKFEADTNFGTNYKEPIITEQNIALLEDKGTDYVDKCNVSYTYHNSNIVWPKGLVTLKDEFYYVRRALKNSAGNDIIKSMQEVVESMSEDGIKEAALYGAGENGRQFHFICKLYGIKTTCFIDRKESIWGTKKEGVSVMGLKEAIEKGNTVFLVTSLFSIGEIKTYIEETFEKQGIKPEIYSV
ncbi:HAD family hydrolase [Anaeromicropila populeti]|uniref:Predicted hydrolase, HAD superfamily n=1 Tax=Anaeromicropila populeti TaxID=37658 RepID=A0A1I6HWC7_9FIRM|nr:HAD family hydrolase [Anaeromicropila populeti]SFR58729.1 Predicted hydrolase, HAD superfamily [Anaeromicropila populeti]